jgi:predicted ATPase
MEKFGEAAGLFNELSVAPLGKTASGPFQIQIRRFDRKTKGLLRNLIDVGYGVSQALPIITELLRDDVAPLVLLQQPEVHLHPSAQAALGTLFCEVAHRNRQVIVETHSDHLLDRVRMDMRDKKTMLKPEDVSILYFERGDLDVHIHSLKLDEEGNVLHQPPGYRQFFMEEANRSIGF